MSPLAVRPGGVFSICCTSLIVAGCVIFAWCAGREEGRAFSLVICRVYIMISPWVLCHIIWNIQNFLVEIAEHVWGLESQSGLIQITYCLWKCVFVPQNIFKWLNLFIYLNGQRKCSSGICEAYRTCYTYWNSQNVINYGETEYQKHERTSGS